jgi:uncharacterized OB-fold protein
MSFARAHASTKKQIRARFHQRKARAKKIHEGQCLDCQAAAMPERRRCELCADRMRLYLAKYRASAKQAGL